MTKPLNNSQYKALKIIEICQELGVKHAVISPGLRCAPLIKAASKLNLSITSCIDERAAGYFALGLYKANKTKSILICTSGTAVLNYLPALAEAKKTNTPILLITADRPKKLIQNNSNQTTDQTLPLKPFLENQLTIDLDIDKNKYSEIVQFFNKLQSSNGPNQINIHFSEPIDDSEEGIKKNLEDIKLEKKEIDNPTKIIPELLEDLKLSKNPLIIVASGSYTIAEFQILKDSNIPIMLDITSNLKGELTAVENLVPSFDHPEIQKYYSDNPPDLIIKFGQYLISKHFLKLKGSKNLKIYQEKINNNQEICIEVNEKKCSLKNNLFKTIKTYKAPEKFNFKNWDTLSNRKRKIIENSEFTFPFISKNFLDIVKDPKTVILGNSTIVRTFDYYIPDRKLPKHSIITNRGVSGIEGFTMMSRGVAKALNKPVIVFNGDISFLHDLNSLHELKKQNQVVIYFLLNNRCGGIFNSIPIKIDSDYKKYMTTDHDVNFGSILKAFNLNYKKIESKNSYLDIINNLDKIKETTIIECFVNDDNNIRLFKELRTLSN
jgi:2-succinyl-5-enolpyruvyl-6-hydroxy-3-cyclohexene-1-carboxylate synthase